MGDSEEEHIDIPISNKPSKKKKKPRPELSDDNIPISFSQPKFKPSVANLPPVDNQSDWQCSRCTFLNQANIPKCQICAFSKAQSAALSQIQAVSKDDGKGSVDLSAPSSDLLVDADAEWQCAMCASINKAESEQCGACTYSKAKSVQSFLNLQEEKAQIAAALAASAKDHEEDALKKVIQEEEANNNALKKELNELQKEKEEEAENEEDKNKKVEKAEPKSDEIAVNKVEDAKEQKEEKESKEEVAKESVDK